MATSPPAPVTGAFTGAQDSEETRCAGALPVPPRTVRNARSGPYDEGDPRNVATSYDPPRRCAERGAGEVELLQMLLMRTCCCGEPANVAAAEP